jgi:hypothetical protein
MSSLKDLEPLQGTLVGLGDKSRVGKDTAAEILEQFCDFSRFAFAEPIKKTCAAVFGFNNEQLHGSRKEYKDEFWNITPRQAFQDMGTVIRRQFGPDVFIRSLYRRMQEEDGPTARFVISDVRLPEEVEAIRAWGGKVYRIDRDVPSTSTHRTETALSNYNGWDGVINNKGTIPQLRAQLEQMFPHPRSSYDFYGSPNSTYFPTATLSFSAPS